MLEKHRNPGGVSDRPRDTQLDVVQPGFDSTAPGSRAPFHMHSDPRVCGRYVNEEMCVAVLTANGGASKSSWV